MALVGLRAALESLLGPARAGRFTDADLRLLLEGGYATLDDLKDASYTGLQQAGLKPARADQIFHAQGEVLLYAVGHTELVPGAGDVAVRGSSPNLVRKRPQRLDVVVSRSLDLVEATLRSEHNPPCVSTQPHTTHKR